MAMARSRWKNSKRHRQPPSRAAAHMPETEDVRSSSGRLLCFCVWGRCVGAPRPRSILTTFKGYGQPRGFENFEKPPLQPNRRTANSEGEPLCGGTGTPGQDADGLGWFHLNLNKTVEGAVHRARSRIHDGQRHAALSQHRKRQESRRLEVCGCMWLDLSWETRPFQSQV